nr:polyprenyl synthetase family protein [Streptomyces sp. NBC_00899]
MTNRMRLGQPTAPSAQELLERCRRMVQPALRDTVDRLPPGVRHMAAFAFGWSDADGVVRSEGMGKGLRPALTMLSAEAVGGSAEDAVAGAVAVELVHAFSLIHDDIMDGDERRRHQETLWKAFGVGPAMLAGDALLSLAFATVSGTAAAEAAEMLSTALIELVDGQADDIAFEDRPWTGADAVTVDDYTRMAANKTGSLLACSAGLGALFGGGSPTATAAFATAGSRLGGGFQAIDDLLGIWGDPAVTGKPVFNDLRRRKKTLPVVFALGVDDAAHAPALVRLLDAEPDASDTDLTVRRAADLIEQVGGRSFTEDQAEGQLSQALEVVDDVAVNRRAAAELTALARFIADRSH